MVIALFEHRLQPDVDVAEWERACDRMVELALAVPGFVSINGYRAADGTRLSIVRFDSEEAFGTWRSHPEHLGIRVSGREAFFASYRMTVASAVIRECRWSS